MSLIRLACPRCGYSPGEFLPGAAVYCGGQHTGPDHRIARMVPTNPLPLDDNTQGETR